MTTRNALFAFEQRASAHRAIDRLLAGGVPARAIWLHTNEGDSSDDFGGDLEQFLDSAFVHRFSESLRGAFERGSAPREGALFANVVQHGGAVVSVDVVSSTESGMADHVMEAAPCELRTAWSESPARPTPRNESPLFARR